MIIGVGTDLIETERVTKACERNGFLTRVYTKKEIDMIADDIKKAAGNFAVKEAVSKVLGTGFKGCTPIDIEVLRDKSGKPFVCLYNGALRLATELGIRKFHISISNTKEYTSAFAVGEQ